MLNVFPTCLRGFNLKRLVFWAKNDSNCWIGWGIDRPPVQLVEVRVDPQLNQSTVWTVTDRPPAQPVKGAKNFLYLPERLFNRLRLNLNWLRSGWLVPYPVQPVEPFLAKKTNIFNLKPFKQVGKTFDTRF